MKNLDLPEHFLVTWIEWASKDRLLMSIYRPSSIGRHGGRGKVGGSKIMSIPLYGQDYVFLFGDQASVVRDNRYLTGVAHMLPGDPEHVLLPADDGNRYSLWKVNILSGEGEVIAKGDPSTFAWFTDAKGLPSLRFDCEDGRYCPRVSVNARRSDSGGSDKADWLNIMTFDIDPNEEFKNYEFWPLAAAQKAGQFYVLADRDEDSTAHIKLYDITQKDYIKTVYKDPNWDVSGALIDEKLGTFEGAWQWEDQLSYIFKDPKIQGHYDRILSEFKSGENVSFSSYDVSNGKAVVYVTSQNTPGDNYLYDLETHSLSFLLQRYPALFEAFNSKTELLDIKARDGVELRGYLTTPQDVSDSVAPLIVMPHGGTEARDYNDYDPQVQYFVSLGFSVLKVNFRGSSGYGRKFAEAGFGEWGGVMQDDITDAVQMLYDQGRAVPDRTCIVGYSYGGYAALMAGATTPKLFKCIVSGGGISDLLFTLKLEQSKYGKSSYIYKYWVKSIGDPKADKAELENLSPVNMAENFQAPVLLLHGERDRNTGPGNSKMMVKALKRAKKDVTFLELEDAAHTGWSVDTEVLYLETVSEFLDKHIGD